jgi:hypothetical protein
MLKAQPLCGEDMPSARLASKSGKQMQRWSVDIIRGRWTEHLGTVEAPDQREAYRLAIENFNIPIERQNRLFVVKIDKDRRSLNV